MSYVNYDSHSSIRGGISGQSGYMDPDLYLKKQERTCMYEDSNTLNDYFRSTLRDRKPDKATLEQDMPKSKAEQNNLRNDILNLRYNIARTSAEPFMPDLFLGFTERDERGYHNQPHMERANEQARLRMKFKDLRNDYMSDQVVPEHTRSDERLIKDMRNSINPIKERLKIFTTARDSRAVQSASHTLTGSAVDKSKHDATLEESMKNINLQNNTSLKSNMTKIGYRKTTDHEFNVGRYVLVRDNVRRSNIYEAQKNVTMSQDYENDPAILKNKLIKVVYDELSKQRKEGSEMSGDFTDGISTENFGKRKLKSKSIDKKNVLNTHEYTQGEVNRAVNKSLKFKGDNLFDKSLIDAITMNEKLTTSRNKNKKKRTKNLLHRESYKSSKDTGRSIKTHVYTTAKSKFIKHAETKLDNEFNMSNIMKNNKMGVLENGSLNGLTTEDHDMSENKIIESFAKRGGNAKKIHDNTIEDTILGDGIETGTRTRANIVLRRH